MKEQTTDIACSVASLRITAHQTPTAPPSYNHASAPWNWLCGIQSVRVVY